MCFAPARGAPDTPLFPREEYEAYSYQDPDHGLAQTRPNNGGICSISSQRRYKLPAQEYKHLLCHGVGAQPQGDGAAAALSRGASYAIIVPLMTWFRDMRPSSGRVAGWHNGPRP
ncbi:MAG: hypothetical protein OHK0022_11590 [Roseiflexaceae bacterium]